MKRLYNYFTKKKTTRKHLSRRPTLVSETDPDIQNYLRNNPQTIKTTRNQLIGIPSSIYIERDSDIERELDEEKRLMDIDKQLKSEKCRGIYDCKNKESFIKSFRDTDVCSSFVPKFIQAVKCYNKSNPTDRLIFEDVMNEEGINAYSDPMDLVSGKMDGEDFTTTLRKINLWLGLDEDGYDINKGMGKKRKPKKMTKRKRKRSKK